MPEAIVNYLAHMSWQPTDGREIFSLAEAAEMFELERLSKSPAVFDVAKLNWFNGQYIRSLPLNVVTDRALPFLEEYDTKQYSREELEHIVASVRETLTMLLEIKEAVRFYFEKKVEPNDEANSALGSDAAKKVLKTVLDRVDQFPWGDPKGCKSVVDGIGKELGLKGKDLYWPVRAALQGKTSGPDLGVTLSILGKDRVKTRIEGALGLCHR
jgi:nondiscriminating glutamyl-tRNA synthetase